MTTLAKVYSVHATFVFAHEVSPEELQAALLRAVATEAFAVPGQVTIDLVTPQDDSVARTAYTPPILLGSSGPK